MSVVAIVGRPNVGKSTIFNILTASKSAIVADFSGLTRDRKYGRLKDSQLTLIDTGGLNEDTDDMSQAIKEQTDLAIEEADYLLFVVDAIDGLLPTDKEIAKSLRKQNKEITLLINKADNSRLEESSAEFNSLGFKSTLVNALIGEERLVVSSQSGTTRDSIDVPLETGSKKFTLIDTAGMRRKRSIKEETEKFSVSKSVDSIKRADLVVILIDASENIVDQDIHLLGLTLAIGRPVLVVANKIDLLSKQDRENLESKINRKLKFASYIKLHYISAKNQRGLKKLLKLTDTIYKESLRDLDTSITTNKKEKKDDKAEKKIE